MKNMKIATCYLAISAMIMAVSANLGTLPPKIGNGIDTPTKRQLLSMIQIMGLAPPTTGAVSPVVAPIGSGILPALGGLDLSSLSGLGLGGLGIPPVVPPLGGLGLSPLANLGLSPLAGLGVSPLAGLGVSPLAGLGSLGLLLSSLGGSGLSSLAIPPVGVPPVAIPAVGLPALTLPQLAIALSSLEAPSIPPLSMLGRIPSLTSLNPFFRDVLQKTKGSESNYFKDFLRKNKQYPPYLGKVNTKETGFLKK